jgi:hypothetical protein
MVTDIGEVSTITVNTIGLPDDTVSVYIDWNQDSIFQVEGETIIKWSGAGEHTAQFTPPRGMPEGETRMRIRALYMETGPCGAPGYFGGETEDYTVNVTWSKPKALEMISPDGGEQLNVNDTYIITWETNEDIPNVTLKFQADDGVWLTIAENIPNEGSFEWTVPDISTWVARIEVSNPAGDETNTSDGVFSIHPLAVLAPTAGEQLELGTVYTIQWTVSATIDTVTIHYQIPGGGWELVAEKIPNTGNFDWTVPPTPSDSVKLRIMHSSTGLMALSDSLFSIFGEANIPWEASREKGVDLYLGGQRLCRAYGNFSQIHIRNIRGALIVSLPVEASIAVWNGRDSRMNPVLPGIYFFEFLGNNHTVWKKHMVFP